MTNDTQGHEERLLGALADGEPGPQHMADMMTGVRDRVQAEDRRRKRAGRSAVAAALAVVVAVVLLAVPLSYDVEVGHRLVVSWPTDLADTEAVEHALAQVDGIAGRKTGFREGEAHATLIIIGPTEDEAVEAVRAALASHLPSQVVADLSSTVITRRVGGNVLAALTHGSFRVSARGLSDDEVELAIIEELGLIGVRGADADVTDTADGSKRIDVQMSDSPYDSLTFEVEF